MTRGRTWGEVAVARQGIFDRSGAVVGHELLFRLPPERQAPVLATEADHELATAEVIRSVLDGEARSVVDEDLLLFLNVPRAFVVGRLPLTLPPERIVVEVLEHVVPDQELIEGVMRLREAGYLIAVDDWNGEDERRDLIAAAHYVKIDMQQVRGGRLECLVAEVRRTWPDMCIVLERVESPDDHDIARRTVADLFQGFALQNPQYLAVS